MRDRALALHPSIKQKGNDLMFEKCTVRLIQVFALFLVSSHVVGFAAAAQTVEISGKFLCYLSDPAGPRIFQVKRGVPTELEFSEALKIANRAVRKAKARVRKLRAAGASAAKIRRANKKKRAAIANRNNIRACQDDTIEAKLGTPPLDPPVMGMSMVDVVGSPDATLTGTCMLSYMESPEVIGGASARALADKTLVDVTCDMSRGGSGAAVGDILWGPDGSRGNDLMFIAGLNLAGDSFSIISCDFKIGIDCDMTEAMALDLADPNAFVGIEFTFDGNSFSGVFPDLVF